jgi:hypothetical protein
VLAHLAADPHAQWDRCLASLLDELHITRFQRFTSQDGRPVDVPEDHAYVDAFMRRIDQSIGDRNRRSDLFAQVEQYCANAPRPYRATRMLGQFMNMSAEEHTGGDDAKVGFTYGASVRNDVLSANPGQYEVAIGPEGHLRLDRGQFNLPEVRSGFGNKAETPAISMACRVAPNQVA